jgi:hypothetical protein
VSTTRTSDTRQRAFNHRNIEVKRHARSNPQLHTAGSSPSPVDAHVNVNTNCGGAAAELNQKKEAAARFGSNRKKE